MVDNEGALVYFNLGLTPRDRDRIQEIAKAQGVSVTQILRRAAAFQIWLDEELKLGSRVVIERHGVSREVVFL